MKEAIKYMLIIVSIPILLLSYFAYGYWAGATNSLGILNTQGLVVLSAIGAVFLVTGLLIKTK